MTETSETSETSEPTSTTSPHVGLSASGTDDGAVDYAAADSGRVTGWTGWVAFAGVMMVVLGLFQAIEGLVAIFERTYYLVAPSGLVVSVDYSAWGWLHLVLGVLAVAAGVGLIMGNTLARVVGVVLAVISAVTNLAFIAAYPVWSTIIIAVDIIVIYAIVVHGREMKNI